MCAMTSVISMASGYNKGMQKYTNIIDTYQN